MDNEPDLTLATQEREHIKKVLEQKRHLTQSAEALGISRVELWKKMTKYELTSKFLFPLALGTEMEDLIALASSINSLEKKVENLEQIVRNSFKKGE